MHSIGAGLCAAALTGAVIGAAIVVFSLFTDPGSHELSILFLIPASACYGLVIGGIPGVLVVSLSRARHAPWRSIPLLTAGTSGGFIAGMLLAGAFHLWDWAFVAAVVGAILGGIVAINLTNRMEVRK